MSQFSNQQFPRDLIDELDRILLQIRSVNDQAETLINRARDICALAKRTVAENTKVHLEMLKADDRVRRSDQVIEREAQREAERREQAIDAGHIKPAMHPSYGGTTPFKTLEQMSTDFVVGTLRDQQDRVPATPVAERDKFDPQPRLIIGVHEGQFGAFMRGDDGVLSPMSADKQFAAPAPAPEKDRLTPAERDRAIAEVVADIAKLSDREAAADLPDPELPADHPRNHPMNPIDGGMVMPLDTAPLPIVDPTAFRPLSGDETIVTIGMDFGPEATLDEFAPVGDEETSNSPLAAEENDTGAVDVHCPPAEEPAAPVDHPDGAEAPSAAPSQAEIESSQRSPRDIVETVQRRAAGEPVDTAARQQSNAVAVDRFYEDVLKLWSTTTLTEAQVGKRLGATKALVTTVLEHARADGDERADRSKSKSKPAPAPKENLMPSKGHSSAPPWKPFVAQTGVERGEFSPPSSATHISTGVCTVDLEANKIYGKRGMWSTSAEVARTVAKLNKGQMFSQDTILKDCAWPNADTLRRGITPMMERLRDIGVELISLPVGLKIKETD